MQFTEQSEHGKVLQSQLLLQQSDIEHYSSLKESLNPEQGVWMPKQIHSDKVVRYEDHLSEDADIPEADAVICQTPGQWIGVRTADCVPVLLYDPEQRVIAAVHAGWRGTVQHIVQKTHQRLISDYGSDPSDIYAMVGPSISPESFEVGPEVADAFRLAGRSDCILEGKGSPWIKPHIDLWQSNVMDLLESGIELDHIDCTPLCTLQNSDILYSARKEGISTGRIVSAIRLIG